jgi:hypothetical protein
MLSVLSIGFEASLPGRPYPVRADGVIMTFGGRWTWWRQNFHSYTTLQFCLHFCMGQKIGL